MILFVNKVKIKYEWNNRIKKIESQFTIKKIPKDEIKKKKNLK
jgi:hypothetical protein